MFTNLVGNSLVTNSYFIKILVIKLFLKAIRLFSQNKTSLGEQINGTHKSPLSFLCATHKLKGCVIDLC